MKRELGRPPRPRQHTYSKGQSAEALAERLDVLRFTLEEEEEISTVDAALRVAKAFDVEKVTKRFYDRFRTEHQAFLGFIKGIRDAASREWYASLMLNRMMFIYFIQKRGFLKDDPDYLRNRLAAIAKTKGSGKFHSFYRLFLRRLFHEGLGQPEAARDAELGEMLGRVPYLNGGLFDVHDLERDNANIDIPDKAFKQIFDFFDAYQWHLDDRPLRDDNEINPDVLGYIFEKYVNQKQMGAYYTKEDITGYISRNTIVPRLFDQAKRDCAIAFKPGGSVWRLLAEDPNRYFYPSVRHGITLDMHDGTELDKPRALPKEIAAGLKDVAKRGEWNNAASPEYALPTETWREHIARRQRYEDVRGKLAAGEVCSINDLVTYNLDIEQFAEDAVRTSEGPELVRAFWKAIRNVTVLDPTVGSGAFLFAALNVLEPLYNACLDAMRGLVDDLKHSRRKQRPDKLGDFAKVLDEMDKHPSERYFVLKSIVIDNLYGVDIMEEAVEICKLRLFLKLVAQLESYEQIEPLPDIDFNVRPRQHAGGLHVDAGGAGHPRQRRRFSRLAASHQGERGRGRQRLPTVPRHADGTTLGCRRPRRIENDAAPSPRRTTPEARRLPRRRLRHPPQPDGIAQMAAQPPTLPLARGVLRDHGTRRVRRGDRQPAVHWRSQGAADLRRQEP